MRTSRHSTALFLTIFQRVGLIININQIFNKRQQEYYCDTDELKCDNLCSKYFSVTQMLIHMSHPQHSVAETLSRVSGDRT